MSAGARPEIARAIIAIADRLDGRPTPHDVVEAARDERSPLHAMFEWDNKVAAEQHRLDQARQLIRSVQFVVTTRVLNAYVPAFVRDPTLPRNEAGYISVSRLKSDREASRDLLVEEFSRAAAILRRARHLAIALNLAEDVDVLMTDLVGLQRIAVDIEVDDRTYVPPPEPERPRGRGGRGSAGRGPAR